jgi:hypothetical protein
MIALSNSLQLASILLQCVLVVLLVLSFARRYSILLVYSLAYLSATMMGEIILRRDGVRSAAYRTFYWRGEVGLDLLLFLTVIILIYQALEGSAARSRAGILLAAVVALALLLPFVVLQSRIFSNRWFDGASQILNFSAALLNLCLWTALLLTKKRDPRLLGVSLGVGITVTGAAIGYGLLQLIASGHGLINLFSPIAHVTGLVLWCRAFAPTGKVGQRTLRADVRAEMN